MRDEEDEADSGGNPLPFNTPLLKEGTPEGV